MSRDVSVKLTLDADPYVTSAAKATAATEVMDESLNSLDKQVTEAGRDLEKLAAQAEVAKRGVSSFDDRVKTATTDVKGLDDRIKAAKTSVGQMAVQYSQSGDVIDRKNLSSARSALALLEKTRKDILAYAASRPAEEAAILTASGIAKAVSQETEKGLIDGTKELFDSVGGLKGILIGGAVALSPLLGSIISGAVVGAVGLGGIAGGIFSAAKDQRVQAAAHDFVGDLENMFFNSKSSTAFAQPIINGLQILENSFAKADIGSAFAKAAPYVTTLATGIGQLVDNLMPGFNEVMDNSGPIITSISAGLAHTGTALSSFLVDVERSPGTIEGLDAAFNTLDGAISGTGELLGTLGDAYDALKGPVGFVVVPAIHWMEDLAHGAEDVVHAVDDVVNSIGSTATLTHQVERVSKGIDQAAASSLAAAQATDRYRTSMQLLDETLTQSLNDQLQLWQDQIGTSQAIADASKQIAENRGEWNQNTDAARANQQAVTSALQSAQSQYSQAIANAHGNKAAVDQATLAYDAQVQQLLKLAAQAGATKAQLQQLAKTYTITVTTQYYTVGGRSVGGVNDQLIPHHAAGTSYAPAGQVFEAGEFGPELVYPTQSVGVMNAATTAQAWRGGGSSVAAGPVSLTMDFTGSVGQVAQAMMDVLRPHVQGNFGGDVSLAFSGTRRGI